MPPQQRSVPVIHHAPQLALGAPLLAPDPGILGARPLLRARRALRRGGHLPALIRRGFRDLRVRVAHPHGVLGQRQVARVERVPAHGLRYTRHPSIPVHMGVAERDRVMHGRRFHLERRLARHHLPATHHHPVRLLHETALLLLLIVVAHGVAAAYVAHLVRQLRLRLPVPESVRPHGDPARFLLGGREPGRGSAGARRIVDRRVPAVVLVAPSTLLRPGRLRSLVEHPARVARVVVYRHRYPGGRPSPKPERHGRATRMRPATLRRPFMLVL